MKNYRLFLAVAALSAALSSCSRATIEGSFRAAPSSGEVIIKTLGGSQSDTLALAPDGSFKTRVKPNDAEFYFLYSGEVKVASLLLSSGDKVRVLCDTLGSWTVEGSDECARLRENELKLSRAGAGGKIQAAEFIALYREMTGYVMANSHSLTVVPVLFGKIGEVPLFGQYSDGIIFNAVADSLEAVYPASRYVSVLRKEGKARLDAMSIRSKFDKAAEIGFPDLCYPDIEGKERRLSEVDAKNVVVLFWDATDAKNKLYNQDVLLPLYRKYASAGTQFYAVNLGADKVTWAMVVKGQKLPWINVCDTKGSSIGLYGLYSLPTVFLIQNGELVRVGNVKELQRKLTD